MAHPRQARVLTWAGLRWVWRHRAWSPYHLACYWRYFWKLRVRRRHVVTRGMVFLAPGVEITCRRGYGYLEIGRFVHVGRDSALRVHEGRLRIGDKVVLGGAVTINAYLDVEVGAGAIVADDVYVIDFDHRFDRPDVPIKDQGVVKAPVRVGPDVWLGAKASVLRGVVVGPGAVVGAHAVVTRDVPAGAVVAGVPARVVRHRGEPHPGPAGEAGSAHPGSAAPLPAPPARAG